MDDLRWWWVQDHCSFVPWCTGYQSVHPLNVDRFQELRCRVGNPLVKCYHEPAALREYPEQISCRAHLILWICKFTTVYVLFGIVSCVWEYLSIESTQVSVNMVTSLCLFLFSCHLSIRVACQRLKLLSLMLIADWWFDWHLLFFSVFTNDWLVD